MLKCNIKSKYLKRWNNNLIFVKITDEKEFEILRKYKWNINGLYNEDAIYYCKNGYASEIIKESVLKKYPYHTILEFREFFTIGEDLDERIDEIEDLNNIYDKIKL